MDDIEKKKEIIFEIVKFVSRMYQLGDEVLVEFEPASMFASIDVTARTTDDFRIIFNIDRIRTCPESEVYVTTFHEMRHIYQYCCIEFGHKYPQILNEPKERILKWKEEITSYYVSDKENDEKYLSQDCEIDAIAFAYLMMKEIYGIKVVIPLVIKDRVLDRSEEINEKLELVVSTFDKI